MNAIGERFSHIYYETGLENHPGAKAVFDRFPNAVKIPVRRYTDVFNRTGQDYAVQMKAQSIILAEKHGSLIYPGAKVCHDFGSDRFFYTASAINCIYDCAYCWLKGMYGSANLVIFLNLEDYFQAAEELLKEGPMYLSLSFESDLPAIEAITNHIAAWNRFTLDHAGLTAEVRTKCANTSLFDSLVPDDRFIFAYTLSPQPVIESMEHGTASLTERLRAIRAAMAKGFPVRICFDPMILIPEWKAAYEAMMETIAGAVPLEAVRDFSIGTYRQSDAYQRRMRRRFPESAVVQYPYETVNGYAQYPAAVKQEMEQFLRQLLAEHTVEEKIFLLEDKS